MAAGTTYNLAEAYQPREFYRVETGVRKSGPWKLDTTNLVDGSLLPPFTPVEADFSTRKVKVVRNVRVVEAYTAGGATTIKIAKGSLAYVGMYLGDGTKGATVTAIDKSNENYDVLTIASAFERNIAQGAVLFESTAAGGTVKKNTANFVLYDRKKVEVGKVVMVTLLMQAYEVKEAKLPLPLHGLDKAGLTSRFQFE